MPHVISPSRMVLSQWFVNSDARLRSEVKDVFGRIDTNRDGFIDQVSPT